MSTWVISSFFILFFKCPSEHPCMYVLMIILKHFHRVRSQQWDCWVKKHVLFKFSGSLPNYLPEKCTLLAKHIREPLSLSILMSALDIIKLLKVFFLCQARKKKKSNSWLWSVVFIHEFKHLLIGLFIIFFFPVKTFIFPSPLPIVLLAVDIYEFFVN